MKKIHRCSVEGKIPKSLKKRLKKISGDAEETKLVADAKLENSIKVRKFFSNSFYYQPHNFANNNVNKIKKQEKFSINCVANNYVKDFLRLIRGQMESLIKVPEKEVSAMRIGLAHRYVKNFLT